MAWEQVRANRGAAGVDGVELAEFEDRLRDNLYRVFAPAVSKTARKRMSQIMRSWRIARRTDLNFADLANWVNPVVRGWMNYYGAFRRSELYPLLMQLNAMLAKWGWRKYRRFQRWDRLVRRWQLVVAERPNYFVRWRWITGIGH